MRAWTWRHSLALACALLGWGCGGGPGQATQDDCGVPSVVTLRAVDALPNGRLGETDRCAPGGTLIQLVRGLNVPSLVRLIAHELAHAAGFSAHLDDPDCLLYPVILPALPDPCPTELGWLRTVGGTLDLMPTEEVRAATVTAADHWNRALGRTLFVVR